MTKDVLTKYLAVFLLVCLVLEGILLGCFSSKSWWNNWMIMAPNLFMVLGAFYCHLMLKNVENNPNNLKWLFVYKSIKMALTVAAMVLYIVFVKDNSKAFVFVMAISYFVSLVTETAIYAMPNS